MAPLQYVGAVICLPYIIHCSGRDSLCLSNRNHAVCIVWVTAHRAQTTNNLLSAASCKSSAQSDPM